MNAKNEGKNELFSNIGGLLAVIAGIIIAFSVFYFSNASRISRQNENYIADLTSQRATMIRDLFDENIHYIESAAIVIETEFKNRGMDAAKLNCEEEAEIDPEAIELVRNVLVAYEDRFAFDYLRFIDTHGRDYTTEEKSIQAVVSERE